MSRTSRSVLFGNAREENSGQCLVRQLPAAYPPQQGMKLTQFDPAQFIAAMETYDI